LLDHPLLNGTLKPSTAPPDPNRERERAVAERPMMQRPARVAVRLEERRKGVGRRNRAKSIAPPPAPWPSAVAALHSGYLKGGGRRCKGPRTRRRGQAAAISSGPKL